MLNIPFFALHVLLDTKQASTPTATADAKWMNEKKSRKMIFWMFGISVLLRNKWHIIAR
jgi:hypothetical protein